MHSILMAAAAAGTCTTEIVVEPSGEGLRARFELCAPAQSYAFDDYDAPQRKDAWRLGDGFVFDGVVVKRADGAAFDRFEATIAPDPDFHDRRYVATERVGEGGFALYVGALRGETASRLTFAGFTGEAVARFDGATMAAVAAAITLQPDDGAGNGDQPSWAYVGPAAYVAGGAMTTIAGPEIPGWLLGRVRAKVDAVMTRMRARMGVEPLTPPTLSITTAPSEAQGVKGGQIDGSVITMSLRGIRLEESDPSIPTFVEETAAHETVHFWLGGVWDNAENDEQPWVHEGGTEYIASRLTQDTESLRREAQAKLNACLTRGNPNPIDGSKGPVHGDAPYSCGFVISLLAEAAGAAKGDILDLWTDVFARAVDGKFAPADFLEVARRRGGAAFDRPAQRLLGPLGTIDLGALAEELRAVGIAATARPTGAAEGDLVRGAALMPILRQLCPNASYGYFRQADRLVLDYRPGCAEVLAVKPGVSSVNGVDLMKMPAEAHGVIRKVCAAKGDLIFAGPDGTALPPIRCEAEIPQLPTVFAIERLPQLAPL